VESLEFLKRTFYSFSSNMLPPKTIGALGLAAVADLAFSNGHFFQKEFIFRSVLLKV